MDKQYEEKIEELKKRDVVNFSEDEMILWQYYICCTYFDDPLETEADYSED